MKLNEEQKARAQKIAEAVGDNPGKYFANVLKVLAKKSNDQMMALRVNAKLKLGEKYAQILGSAQQAKADTKVIKEAYRLWYEKTGKDLMTEEESRLKALFDKHADELESLWTVLKKDAKEIANMAKKKK